MAEQVYTSQFDKMTKMPVSRLILQLGIPTTLSMLVTNIYNLVDTWFVGKLGTSASGAIGIVFGLMAIIQAVGFMFGQGAGSSVSRLLGAKNEEKANRFSATAFYLALLAGLLILVLGRIFLTPLCMLLGSTETILPYARLYAMCILAAAPAMTISCVMNNVLRFEGHAVFSMIGLVSGSIINIAGDAICIMVLHMGIVGAGLATAISQYISAVILISMFLRGKTQTGFSPKYFTPKGEIVGSIIAVGFPSLIRQGLSSVSSMVLNNHVKIYGDAAVAAMSIVTRLCNFIFCVGMGIGQGYQPVCGFNYGAKLYSRVKKGLKFTICFGIVLLGILAVIGFIFAGPLVQLMRDDPDVVAIGIPAMRAQCISLLLVPFALCANMLFQSTGNSIRASIVAALRSGVCFIPTVIIFSRILGLQGIEISQATADAIASLISIPLLINFIRSLPADGIEYRKPLPGRRKKE